MKQHQPRAGLSLIEILVAIGIMTLLLALLLVAIMNSRQTAHRVQCVNSLRQIGLALQNYHATHLVFPPGAVHMTTKPPGTAPDGNDRTDGRAPWAVLLLPYLDETARFNRFNFNATFSPRFDLSQDTPEPNKTEQYSPFAILQCPNDPNSGPGATHSNFAACQGGGLPSDAAEQSHGPSPRLFFDNGLFFHNSSTSFRDITDGTSSTIMVGETKYVGTPQGFGANGAWWSWASTVRAHPVYPSLFNISAAVDPINYPQNGEFTEEDILDHQGLFQGASHSGQQRVFGSYHQGGAYFLFADGSAKFLNENMDLIIYRSLGNRRDGLPKGDF
jgi:prepilin-type processing-associated H-X9-DG protein